MSGKKGKLYRIAGADEGVKPNRLHTEMRKRKREKNEKTMSPYKSFGVIIALGCIHVQK